MKLVIISDKADISTNKVCEWGLEKMLRRINENDYVNLNSFQQLIPKITWLRRGNIPIFQHQVYQKFHKEIFQLNRFFHYQAEASDSCLGSLTKEYDHNKLIDLEKAKLVGLAIPETHILSTKKELIGLLNTNKQWITKSMNDPMTFQNEGKKYSIGFTSRITKEFVNQLPDRFYPSLIQEEIKKQVELRIFYLKGTFYPMAIFSQKDKQTAVDYRHYNREKPNRNVPFKLPKQIEDRLEKLMNQLELNTGSIDIILNKENKYVFLEVNPVGQFDWVSVSCNYQIERAIAKILTNEKRRT